MATLPIVAAKTSNQLVDLFGRVHTSLRISVTDRCNLRCLYCMPESADDFEESEHLLSFDQIVRLTRILASVGIEKLRITGGEPTLRSNLPELIARLRAIPGIKELAMTTNGMRLDRLAGELRRAGLSRVNISLDALNEDAFYRITRRRGLTQVIRGIDAAIEAGFSSVRLNALAIKGLNEDQIMPLVEFAFSRGLTLRFIEYMPLGGDRDWQTKQVLSGAELRARIEKQLGPLTPLALTDPSQPSTDFGYGNGKGKIGFINSVSEPFCGNCNRLRLTAEGALRNCLFSHQEWSLKPLLTDAATDAELLAEIRRCVTAKQAGHLITNPAFRQPDRPMYKIGG